MLALRNRYGNAASGSVSGMRETTKSRSQETAKTKENTEITRTPHN